MGTIVIDNQQYEYERSYKSKRNINIRIDSNSLIKVSAPRRVSKAEVESVLLEKANWIKKNIEKQKTNKQNVLETGNNIWFKGKEYKLYYKQADYNNVITFDEYILVYSKHVDDELYTKEVFKNWLRDLSQTEFKEALEKYSNMMKPYYNIPNYSFGIREMKTRWGTCMPTEKKINLSLNLMYVPHEYMEYVALHELAHFVELHHNERFYRVIEQFMPDYKVRQKALNKEYSFISR